LRDDALNIILFLYVETLGTRGGAKYYWEMGKLKLVLRRRHSGKPRTRTLAEQVECYKRSYVNTNILLLMIQAWENY